MTPTLPASPVGAPTPVPGPPTARGRILDAALGLMSRHGASATSMRQLATACELNVATLYHYFPSKAHLLQAVIQERRYGERLAAEPPPLDPTAPPRERLADLVEWLWLAALQEEAVWRLLVGEAIRNDDVAVASARSLVDALEATFVQWLAASFPELQVDPAVAARLLRDQVFALVVEHLATGATTPPGVARARAGELATLLLP
jgi:AcrR family transcriptional regulator